MALKKIVKKENKKVGEIEQLKKQLVEAEKVLAEQKEKTLAIKRRIFDLEHAPFKESDHVMMMVSKRTSKKECECLLVVELMGYGEYEFKAYPYKDDGTLSSRGFIVYNLSDIRPIK